MSTTAPTAVTLRKWQAEAMAAHEASTSPGFLVTACPAAGKTSLGALLARQALESGRARRIVIGAPTVHICHQWESALARVGVAIQAGRANHEGPEPAGVHGVAVTYQSLTSASGRHLARSRDRATFVIFDEPHHIAEHGAWGDAVRRAFGHEEIAGRLLLSGTPFRTDRTPIPFVAYDDLGRAIPDYSYSYAQAITDHVCRPLEMVRFEGEMRWSSDGRDYEASFAEEMNGRDRARRYRTALRAGVWLPTLLRAAHERLTGLRDHGGHPDAGGLVICADQEHARSTAKMLQRVTGRAPVLVLSDDEFANSRIERFNRSIEPWMVAVRMVSEGVDIPRLRVGVYATVARTEMNFRQVVGRFVRRQAHLPGDQRAYLYLASDPDLLALARRLADAAPGGVALRDRTSYAEEALEQATEVGAAEEDDAELVPEWFPQDASAIVADGVLDEQGSEFSADEINALRSACARLGISEDPVTFGRMGGLFQVLDSDWSAPTPEPTAGESIMVNPLPTTDAGASDPPLTITERLRELRGERTTLVRDIARLEQIGPEQVNGELKRQFGAVSGASVKQLERGNQYARKWRDRLQRPLGRA